MVHVAGAREIGMIWNLSETFSLDNSHLVPDPILDNDNIRVEMPDAEEQCKLGGPHSGKAGTSDMNQWRAYR